MKRVLTIFFVTLGVIFFVLILAGVYFYMADPLNLKPVFFPSASDTEQVQSVESTNATDSVLSAEQEQALETFGIDPASVPSDISPEQEACFEATLGEERVAEIKAGAAPTPTEFFRAKDCW